MKGMRKKKPRPGGAITQGAAPCKYTEPHPIRKGGRINVGSYGGTAEPVSKTIIAGYINGGGKVDWTDLTMLSRHWLQDARN
ncbi:MAG: hypothetical protein ABFE13_19480 [Phycisphaerales bacterium]